MSTEKRFTELEPVFSQDEPERDVELLEAAKGWLERGKLRMEDLPFLLKIAARLLKSPKFREDFSKLAESRSKGKVER